MRVIVNNIVLVSLCPPPPPPPAPSAHQEIPQQQHMMVKLHVHIGTLSLSLLASNPVRCDLVLYEDSEIVIILSLFFILFVNMFFVILSLSLLKNSLYWSLLYYCSVRMM